MKIRITDNSIRARLNASEIAALAQGNVITCQLQFGAGSTLCYELHTWSEKHSEARMSGNIVSIHIPETVAIMWENSDEVSFQFVQNNDTEKGMKIMIEKDLMKEK